MTQKIFVIGKTNIDILFHVARMPHEHEKMRVDTPAIEGGGSAANTACWLAYQKRTVTMLTGIADDLFADLTIRLLEEHGIVVACRERQAGTRSGVAAILSSGSDKRMIIGRSTVSITNEMIETLDVSLGSHIHFAASDRGLASTIVAKAKQCGATVSSELNGVWSVEQLAECDICFSNMDDLIRVGLDQDELIRHARISPEGHLLVVTDGTKMVRCYSSLGVIERVVNAVTPVDRTGAGDAFNAGFLHAWLDRHPVEVCLDGGLLLAKQAVLQNGARPILSR